MGILFFFIFFVIKKFFIRNISVNINFDVAKFITEHFLWLKYINLLLVYLYSLLILYGMSLLDFFLNSSWIF